MQIVPLVEHPELVDQVAAWGFAEWGHLNSGQTLQSRTAEIHERLNIDRVPVVLVALDDAGPLVGTASLLFDDLEGDPRNPRAPRAASAIRRSISSRPQTSRSAS